MDVKLKAKKDDALIYFLLDTSGSMMTRWDDTIGSVNNFVSEQIEAGSTARFVLATFDEPGKYKVIFNGRIKDAPELSSKELKANGSSTSLLDATMTAIAFISTASQKRRQLVTLTDGGENSSIEYRGKGSLVKESLNAARGKGIDVVMLAVGEEAWGNDHVYGVGNTLYAHATSASIGTGTSTLSARSAVYTMGAADPKNFASTQMFDTAHIDKDGNVSK